MNTTRSRFHFAGSKQILNNAPELSFASGSVHDCPLACGTRRGSERLTCSRRAGWTGPSEHPANASIVTVTPAHTARFITEILLRETFHVRQARRAAKLVPAKPGSVSKR